MHSRCVAALLFVAAASPAYAQMPQKLENLQVFPRDIPPRQLIQRMREFSLALGVRCEHCHLPRVEGVNTFKSDEKPAKTQARAMLRMVDAINGDLLTKLPSHATPAVKVDCVTCHRGLPIPKTLQTTLFEIATTDGGPAAAAKYRELRKTSMGTGRYNFGEWEINELARRLAEASQIEAAITMLETNAEFYPESASIDVMLGELHVKRGEREKAITRYRAALAKEPDHEMALRRLRELQSKQ
jgi:tetratricopeptide (TPR) repeat protein